MSQKSSSERTPLRAVTGERSTLQHLNDTQSDAQPPEGATVQHIWDIVRKSTDVIVALREENSILRNELSALRKGETVLQDRLQDLLTRIDELERTRSTTFHDSPASVVQQVDDAVDVSPKRTGGSGNRGCRTTTITITMQDDARSDMEQRISGLVHGLVEEIKRGI